MVAKAVDIRAVSVARASKLIGISESQVRRHLKRGAPVREDGHIDLIAYGAWLCREVKRRNASD